MSSGLMLVVLIIFFLLILFLIFIVSFILMDGEFFGFGFGRNFMRNRNFMMNWNDDIVYIKNKDFFNFVYECF